MSVISLKMKFLNNTIFICFFFLFIADSVTALQTFILDDYSCRYKKMMKINVGGLYSGSNSSGILKSSMMSSYAANTDCYINLVPTYPHHIIVSIRRIDFRPGCQDKLILNSVASSTSFCFPVSDKRESQTFSSEGNVVVRLKTGWSSSPRGYSGFELTFTSVTNDGYCPTSGFLCNNKNCISKSLTCDGHNHCGDHSEQNCGPSSGAVVGYVFGSIFLIIACIAGVVCCCRRKRRVITTTIHPPPGQQPYGTMPSHMQQYPVRGGQQPQTGIHYPPPGSQYQQPGYYEKPPAY